MKIIKFFLINFLNLIFFGCCVCPQVNLKKSPLEDIKKQELHPGIDK